MLSNLCNPSTAARDTAIGSSCNNAFWLVLLYQLVSSMFLCLVVFLSLISVPEDVILSSSLSLIIVLHPHSWLSCPPLFTFHICSSSAQGALGLYCSAHHRHCSHLIGTAHNKLKPFLFLIPLLLELLSPLFVRSPESCRSLLLLVMGTMGLI